MTATSLTDIRHALLTQAAILDETASRAHKQSEQCLSLATDAVSTAHAVTKPHLGDPLLEQHLDLHNHGQNTTALEKALLAQAESYDDVELRCRTEAARLRDMARALGSQALAPGETAQSLGVPASPLPPISGTQPTVLPFTGQPGDMANMADLLDVNKFQKVADFTTELRDGKRVVTEDRLAPVYGKPLPLYTFTPADPTSAAANGTDTTPTAPLTPTAPAAPVPADEPDAASMWQDAVPYRPAPTDTPTPPAAPEVPAEPKPAPRGRRRGKTQQS